MDEIPRYARNDSKSRNNKKKKEKQKQRMATDTKTLGMTKETTRHSELCLQREAIEESQRVILMRFLATLGMTIGSRNDNKQ